MMRPNPVKDVKSWSKAVSTLLPSLQPACFPPATQEHLRNIYYDFGGERPEDVALRWRSGVFSSYSGDFTTVFKWKYTPFSG